MPLIPGISPIRNTYRFLEAGRLHFKDSVKIFTVHLREKGEESKGLRDFCYWHMDHIQYKNPDVQCLLVKNMTPTPFIRAYLDDGRDVVVDVDSQPMQTIFSRIGTVLAKSQHIMDVESKELKQIENPAYFGKECSRHCMCEVPGQVPCPGIIKMPKHLTGKGMFFNKD